MEDSTRIFKRLWKTTKMEKALTSDDSNDIMNWLSDEDV